MTVKEWAESSESEQYSRVIIVRRKLREIPVYEADTFGTVYADTHFYTLWRNQTIISKMVDSAHNTIYLEIDETY